jgi:hypothetical protein
MAVWKSISTPGGLDLIVEDDARACLKNRLSVSCSSSCSFSSSILFSGAENAHRTEHEDEHEKEEA